MNLWREFDKDEVCLSFLHRAGLAMTDDEIAKYIMSEEGKNELRIAMLGGRRLPPKPRATSEPPILLLLPNVISDIAA
jgi:hypothetical protein